MSYTGIIFDVDGTLLNTIEDLANSMNCVLQKHGFALPEEERDEKKISIYLSELEKEYKVLLYGGISECFVK